ncbi:MAG: sulfopyruvate decarboxylase [Chloroflexi bacterium]|nr:sulfopyruvate decarboxylase [Chloroflexota bacterium]
MEQAKEVPRYAQLMLEGLKEAGVSVVTALPDGLLRSFYRVAAEDPDIRYIRVSNEADMPGIVVGAYLGGKRAVMVMENSGLRQACEPICRLAFADHMPMVMFMPYRGDLGEANAWGHSHAQTMEPMLNALRIPYRVIRNLDEIKPNIKRALIHTDSSQWPVALIFAGECVEVPSHEKA